MTLGINYSTRYAAEVKRRPIIPCIIELSDVDTLTASLYYLEQV
jgi:hypothetical protein